MVIFDSYVSLPEGTPHEYIWKVICVSWTIVIRVITNLAIVWGPHIVSKDDFAICPTYRCLAGTEWMIHWLTINNHPIPPFPSIPWLSTSKSRWRILQRLPPQVGHGILSDVSENSTSVAWLVVSTYPSEKWWSSSVGIMNSPTDWKSKIPWFQTTN